MERDEMVLALARLLAGFLTVKRGGKGHWTQEDERHPDQATIHPITYHLPLCAYAQFSQAACSPRCVEIHDALQVACDYLGIAPETLRQPLPRRRRAMSRQTTLPE